MDLSKLKDEMPFKWKVQTGKPGAKGGFCVAFIDARLVFDKLDEVVGPENWQSDFKLIDGKLYGGIGIQVQPNNWVWKWDCGTESREDKEKGQSSDALKRAAVQWSIGRFLYGLEMQWVNFDAKGKPVNDAGKTLFNVKDITEYVESKRRKFTKKAPVKATIETETKPEPTVNKNEYNATEFTVTHTAGTIARVNEIGFEKLKENWRKYRIAKKITSKFSEATDGTLLDLVTFCK